MAKFTKKETIKLQRSLSRLTLRSIPVGLIGAGIVSLGYVAGWIPIALSIGGTGIAWIDFKRLQKHLPQLKKSEQLTVHGLLKEGKANLKKLL